MTVGRPTPGNWASTESPGGVQARGGFAILGPKIKLLEWMIKQMGNKTLTKLQQKSPRGC
jgi:hypothetical protein